MKYWDKIYSPLIAVTLCTALIATSSGCATQYGCVGEKCRPLEWSGKPLPDYVRRNIISAAVAPSASAPSGTFETFAKGRAEGFAKRGGSAGEKGAKTVAIAGGFMMAGGATIMIKEKPPASIFAGMIIMMAGLAVIATVPVVAIVGAVGGGVSGSLEAVSKDAAKKIDDKVAAIAADRSRQDDLSQQLMRTGVDRTYGKITFIERQFPATEDSNLDYDSLGLSEKSIIIEIGLNRISFLGGSGSDPLVKMQMESYAKIIRTADGELIRSEAISYTSVPRRFSAWTAADAALLNQEMAHAYRMIAEDLVDTLFLVTDYGSRNSLSGPFGREYCIMKGYPPSMSSLRLTLQWQPFTQVLKESDSESIAPRIDNVTYDLLVWKAGGFPSEKRVYERKGITTAPETTIKIRETFTVPSLDQMKPETYFTDTEVQAVTHTLEMDLEPAVEYYWAVRARYTLDGQTNVTRWSRYRLPGTLIRPVECSGSTNDLDYYYRFVTPGSDSLPGREAKQDEVPK